MIFKSRKKLQESDEQCFQKLAVIHLFLTNLGTVRLEETQVSYVIL